MPFTQLDYFTLHRPASSTNGATVVERHSSDFLINGKSLLTLLVKINGGHSDFMGCFVRGFPENTEQSLSELLVEVSAGPAARRVGIYICPECGDIGCGRYSVVVERTVDLVVWRDFAYENGYEDPWIIKELGPFQFVPLQYELAVREAANP